MLLKILTQVTKAIPPQADLPLTEKSGIFYPNESFYCNVCGYRELCRKW